MLRGVAVAAGLIAISAPGTAAGAAEPLRCPAPFAGDGATESAEGEFEIERLEGLRMRAARRLADRHGCQVRVVRRNGRWLAVTEDYSPSRINVAVRDGRVKRALSVG